MLNGAKCQGYSFCRFWVIKGKSTGGKITHPPPRLGLNNWRELKTSYPLMQEFPAIFLNDSVLKVNRKFIEWQVQ